MRKPIFTLQYLALLLALVLCAPYTAMAGNIPEPTMQDVYDKLIEIERVTDIRLPQGRILRTGQTISYSERDDGALQKGFPRWTRYTFPNNFFQGQHRFQSRYVPGYQGSQPPTADTYDGTMVDTLTNLVWLTHATCYGQRNWHEAIELANITMDGVCGLKDGSQRGDWRLPNIRELQSVIYYNWMGYVGGSLPSEFYRGEELQGHFHWSSTSVHQIEGYNPSNRAWAVRFWDGEKQSPLYEERGFFLLVRDGELVRD